MRARTALAVVGALLVAAAGSSAGDQADAQADGVRLLRVGTFSVAHAPRLRRPGDTSRRFVTERAGRVMVVRGSRKLRTPFLDIRGRVSTGGESGLLSIAFHPGFARNRRLFLYYVDRGGGMRVRPVPRLRAATPTARRAARAALVIRRPHPRFNHKGGQVAFGRDGRLYVGFGDGGGGGDPDENAQRLSTLFGKLLRITIRAPGGGYSVPRDNPFVRRARRAPRDLRLRAAQPLPLLLRPPHGRPGAGRRRAGRRGGDRLPAGLSAGQAPARRRELRLGRVRGAPRLRGRPRAAATSRRCSSAATRRERARSSAGT